MGMWRTIPLALLRSIAEKIAIAIFIATDDNGHPIGSAPVEPLAGSPPAA
jgi:hypothetical protein